MAEEPGAEHVLARTGGRRDMLDRAETRERIAGGGMLPLIREFPEQCRRAVEIASAFNPPAGQYSSVVVLGMGGSAVGGDLLRVLLEAEGARVPVIVSRDYRCPGFVGPGTLCIAASYSGNTEETLSAAEDALARSATLLPITTGGSLESVAADRGIPVLKIPSGQPPRSALGYMFLPALLAVSRLGLCRDYAADVEETIGELGRLAAAWGPETETSKNEAKQLAGKLRASLPVIYGSSPVTGLAAFRWKCQFNENAKMHAIWNNLPELDHNEICGWRAAKRHGSLRWIFLRDRQDAPRLRQRLEITRSILASTSIGCTDVWGHGQSLLARTMTTILLGDYVTTYTAVLNGTDPIDIREIDVLKDELAQA